MNYFHFMLLLVLMVLSCNHEKKNYSTTYALKTRESINKQMGRLDTVVIEKLKKIDSVDVEGLVMGCSIAKAVYNNINSMYFFGALQRDTSLAKNLVRQKFCKHLSNYQDSTLYIDRNKVILFYSIVGGLKDTSFAPLLVSTLESCKGQSKSNLVDSFNSANYSFYALEEIFNKYDYAYPREIDSMITFSKSKIKEENIKPFSCK